MKRTRITDLQANYDVVVIGSGLGGLTAANQLAKAGRKVLLLEKHYMLGGLASWFKRKGGHTFDISLHGFPWGMIKSCRKYWTAEIASRIVQVKDIRFNNPQFKLNTSYDQEDFTRILHEKLSVPLAQIEAFFSTVRNMNFYDRQDHTTGELFERFFPGRSDVHRLLLEPIAYANGSTLEDPALTFGIVFSNFMNKGVYIYNGGSDEMVLAMAAEIERNGGTVCTRAGVKRILVEKNRVAGVELESGERIDCQVVISNASLKGTVENLCGEEHFAKDYVESVRSVRLNNSSTQVYIGFKPGVEIEPIGDLLFHSTAATFNTKQLLSMDETSRTFSVYYPHIRPEKARTAIVSSTNANYEDWASLDKEEYKREKEALVQRTLQTLAEFVPDLEDKVIWTEGATPTTFSYYTGHHSSFGTKFEGLAVSENLPNALPGAYHCGSVGIIMSGWLGTINYGVIVANRADQMLENTCS